MERSVAPWIGFAAFVLVAMLRLVPDKRMERAMREQETKAMHDP